MTLKLMRMMKINLKEKMFAMCAEPFMKRMSIRKHGSGVIMMIVDAGFISGVLV